ncbi:MAG: heparinase II/III-family protein [Bacteroidales bacterium]|jgi:hypothetical protein|nr:heparinase II/III-family protein [Bacteroidales bacterium]
MTIVATLLALSCFSAPQIKERNILAKEAEAINLPTVLCMDGSWTGAPAYSDRSFWDGLPAAIRAGYIKRAESCLNYDWPVVKATDYLEFIRSGGRRQEVYAACSNTLIALVMGELVEGKGRFLDQIINAVWYFSEQTWWGWSAHLYFQKIKGGLPDINDPTVDLGVGEVTANLSWTLFMFEDAFNAVHPLIAQRLRQELHRKSLSPYLTRDDFGYMGFRGGRPNNWNPWVNYNMLVSYLLVENDAATRLKAVTKIINSLDKFLNGYPDDGGCDEGPSYWGAAGALLYENLETLKKATGGKFDVFDNQLVKNIGNYFPQVNIHAPYYINFADADARTGGAPSTVYRYGKAINSPLMYKFGAYLAELNHWGDGALGGKIGDQIRDLQLLDQLRNADKAEALVPDFWFPDTEIAGARDKADSYKGFFFGAKGGFNDESHNHNDVGTCLLYYDGKPCLIDLGREEYVAKTFSSRRYEIWTMQSGYHNLPVINGVEQQAGAQFHAKNLAFKASARAVTFSLDIAEAYPPAAKVESWVRTYTLNRGKNFVIRDRFRLAEASGQLSANYITCCKVTALKPGVLQLDGNGFSLEMRYDPKTLTPQIEYIPVSDRSLKNYWPDGVTRIRLVALNAALSGDFHVTIAK